MFLVMLPIAWIVRQIKKNAQLVLQDFSKIALKPAVKLVFQVVRNAAIAQAVENAMEENIGMIVLNNANRVHLIVLSVQRKILVISVLHLTLSLTKHLKHVNLVLVNVLFALMLNLVVAVNLVHSSMLQEKHVKTVHQIVLNAQLLKLVPNAFPHTIRPVVELARVSWSFLLNF